MAEKSPDRPGLCPTHGYQPVSAFGCPECLRERQEGRDAALPRAIEVRRWIKNSKHSEEGGNPPEFDCGEFVFCIETVADIVLDALKHWGQQPAANDSSRLDDAQRIQRLRQALREVITACDGLATEEVSDEFLPGPWGGSGPPARLALCEVTDQPPYALVWTDEQQPNEDCPYNHCDSETPFGGFRITWKGWDKYYYPYVDKVPWLSEGWHVSFNSVEEAKNACQVEFNKKLRSCCASD